MWTDPNIERPTALISFAQSYSSLLIQSYKFVSVTKHVINTPRPRIHLPIFPTQYNVQSLPRYNKSQRQQVILKYSSTQSAWRHPKPYFLYSVLEYKGRFPEMSTRLENIDSLQYTHTGDVWITQWISTTQKARVCVGWAFLWPAQFCLGFNIPSRGKTWPVNCI